ncbi:Glycosyltransferase involved in cell wall bisynthesis [Abditibacterium utsteinense]|uniref:Glycosyltransferase involved in cell wall bisynthesis n=1 Tax=Abditibacterium utsteinense TaxID=1960156 RepID=A0A2S8SPZ0_9BACT|nr:glycosyltransferase family 2 protein [Abditibacterium utsteinense]PQV62865.1 Glycosyltransferase involved in cell wall bisynthesis [Abditibacterium utsteinense]
MSTSISVVVPVYNRGARIQKTLDSVLQQTLAPVEILVIDDGSSDESAAWIENHYRGEKTLRVIRQENQGVAAARNRGLQEARGQYIAFLDHDDVWRPDKLKRQLEVALRHPDAAVIYSLWRDVDGNAMPLPDEYWNTHFHNWTPRTGSVYDWVCGMPCPIVSMSVPLLKTQTLRDIGGFEPATVPCDDWDLWLRLSRENRFEMVPEKLVDYVHHGEQQSSDLVSIHAGMRRTLARQWPFVLRYPKRWWFVWSFYQFLTTAPLYAQAKETLFARRRHRVARLILRVALRSPLSLFSPQWLYLIRRLITRNFENY